jgi:hypothetical protein
VALPQCGHRCWRKREIPWRSCRDFGDGRLK